MVPPNLNAQKSIFYVNSMLRPQATPCTDWSNKYSRRSRGLDLKTVRLYGRQILEVRQHEVLCTLQIILSIVDILGKA